MSAHYRVLGLSLLTVLAIGVSGQCIDNPAVLPQVKSIGFASVESVSMIVLWEPCMISQPIDGYYLTYTNITSNTSYTIDIDGGDNITYPLTGLIPYTNYAVSIRPYNGIPIQSRIQLTAESTPGVISDLMQTNASLTEISISWNPPIMPNGIITVYEIRYRESTSSGPYTVTNTTNTEYSIVGLIPNIGYTIGVRAYTSIGPGEWTSLTNETASSSTSMNLETTSTASIKKSSSMLITSSSIASRTSTISSMTTILATSTSTTSSSTSSAYSPQSSHSSTVSSTTAVASTYSMTSIESSTKY
uniref:Fibronectin type-III domain-containing protein n=1 Tax=Amphimedon queenslandica TaxID=400682 RepID=A0A1X7U9A9_AMPQE